MSFEYTYAPSHPRALSTCTQTAGSCEYKQSGERPVTWTVRSVTVSQFSRLTEDSGAQVPSLTWNKEGSIICGQSISISTCRLGHLQTECSVSQSDVMVEVSLTLSQNDVKPEVSLTFS